MSTPEALAQALAAATAQPHDEALWAAAEDIARSLERPEEVIQAFLASLGDPALPPEAVSSLGARAVAFHDEWGGEPASLETLLARVLEVVPTEAWAFERLSMLYNASARWDALLGLYDRSLAALDADTARDRLLALLDEAAEIARDLAGDAQRAVPYLERRFQLDPSDAGVARTLERLYERYKRPRDLIGLWTARLPHLSDDQAAPTRARIASLWLELEAHAEALDATEALRRAAPNHPDVLPLLERLSQAPEAPVARRAIDHLRARYDEAGRREDLLRVLALGLAVAADDNARVNLHTEMAHRHLDAGAQAEAVAHVAALVVLEPSSPRHLADLQHLAEQTGNYTALADALTHAAERLAATDDDDGDLRLALLVQAADVRCDTLDDAAGATALYGRVLQTPGAPDAVSLPVARRLATLLRSGQDEAQRLAVLERLAGLEPDPAARRAALGDAARLADRLGDTDRALSAWHARLRDEPGDAEALDALIDLLGRAERWDDLVESLRWRANLLGPGREAHDPDAHRADLVAIARTQADRLGLTEAAIETWTTLQTAYGEGPETVDALADLYTRAARWDDLLGLLARASGDEIMPRRRASLRRRVGDLHRLRGDDPNLALAAYAEALQGDPSEAGARAGLQALLEVPEVADTAVALLAAALQATDDWAALLGILEPRLAAATSPRARADLLIEAAQLAEQRGGDTALALTHAARALPLADEDVRGLLESELARLARATSGWDLVVGAYREALETPSDVGDREAALAYRLGEIHEHERGEAAEALDAYLRVAEAHRDRIDAARAVVRVAGRVGRWDAAAEALVATAARRGAVDLSVTEALASVADARSEWPEAMEALTSRVAATEAPAPLLRALETHLAVWQRDRLDDAEAAAATLSRAVARDGGDPETLGMLAALQRAVPSAELVTTLLALADALGAGPDARAVLHEAAAVALDLGAEASVSRPILERLLAEASAVWIADDDFADDSAQAQTMWALRSLVDQHAQTDAAEAVRLLVWGATLPLPRAQAHALRHEAAQRAARDLDDAPRAASLYQGILAEAPHDAEALAALSSLYEAADDKAALLGLRQHALGLADDVDTRLALRLEIAALHAALGDADAEVAALHDNLGERPGHAATIDALAQCLGTAGRADALHAVFANQAAALQQVGETEDAASLWSRAATLAEDTLHDGPRAVVAWRQVDALTGSLTALEALARLLAAQGAPAEAVTCLRRLLATRTGEARRAVVVDLARALRASGDDEAARHTLESHLGDDPEATAVSELLADLYRATAAWEPLAALLTTTPDGGSPGLGALREAAEIFQKRLNDPGRAVPVLEAALALGPDDRAVRAALADALRAAGQLDEARTMLDALVESYGRQRPVERAVVHLHLAQIARDLGDLPGALRQLELASAIDLTHTGIFRMLGEVARDLGQVERAERAYRALLMIVRRQGPSALHGPDGLGPSEVLFELYRLAANGDAERATEILESAFEAAARSPEEARRFEQALHVAGRHDLRLRALELRLADADAPAQRAEVVSDIATVLEGPLGRRDEALVRRLEAVSLSPDDAPTHAAARSLARALGHSPAYADLLGQLGESARAAGLTRRVVDCLLRLGAVYGEDLGDLSAARDTLLSAEAEATGDARQAALQALADAFARLGDPAGQRRALGTLLEEGLGDPAALAWTLSALELASHDPGAVDAGVERLGWALDQAPDLPRALGLLVQAADTHPGHLGVLDLYERVARDGGDAGALLDLLVRRASTDTVSFEALREGVELASRASDARAEALLRRAVALAHARGEYGEAVWALVALSELRRSAEDWHGAMTCLREAARAAEPGEATTLLLDVAALAAGPLGDLALAAETYESLRARDSADRAIWEPLLDVYRRLGDAARLEALINETIEGVYDASARNYLRMERARLLLAQHGRGEEAARTLRDVLDEDPDDTAATQLLADLLEREGRHEALADLLMRQFDSARERRDPHGTRTLGLRLAALLAPTRRDRALDALRAVTDVVADDREVLRALVGLQTDEDPLYERADALEALVAVEPGAEGAALALRLAQYREALSDPEGIERALEAGFRALPTDDTLRGHLEARYMARQHWAGVAMIRELHAVHLADPAARADSLRTAASLWRDQLGDPGRAVALLAEARRHLPGDLNLLAEQARALSAAGQHEAAVGEASQALDGTPEGDPMAVALLRLRAELHTAAGAFDAAAADLERAFAVAGDSLAPELVAALDRVRLAAVDAHDAPQVRVATLRMVEVLPRAGQPEAATELLAELIAQSPNDAEALRLLATLHGEAGRWDAAAAVWHQLVGAVEGPARIEAALNLADACDRAGHPEQARDGLEQAYGAQRDHVGLRGRLRALYEAAGLGPEAAALWIDEAAFSEDDNARFEAWRSAGASFADLAADHEQAVEALEKARALRPADHETVVRLSDAYTSLERLEEASALLNEAIAAHKGRRSKDLATLQHRMARLAYAAGDAAVELAWLNAALDTDMQNGQVAAELADVAMEAGNYDTALKALRAVTLMKTPGPMSRALAFLRQGQIASAQGDPKKAVFLARKALSEDAQLEEGHTFLRELGVE